MNNSTAHSHANKIRESTNHNKWLGGGVAIGIDKSLTYRDLSALIPEAIQDMEMVFV
jgi:hypothetical protein